MECDSKMDWRTTLRIPVRAALALIVLCLLVIPVAIQADLKATSVVYTWDFFAVKFQNSNVVIPWNGTWIPFLHELNFDIDPWLEPQGCDPGQGTPWAGNMFFGLYHVDDSPLGAPGFQESWNWSLISCDRNQDGAFDNGDLLAPPSPYQRPVVYAECTSTGDHCRVEPSERDVVTPCLFNCDSEIVTTIRVNLDLNCDHEVDPDLGIPTDRYGAPMMLCFYAEARTPTLAEQAGLVWQPPLQARISTNGGDKTVNFAPEPYDLPSAAFAADPLSGTVPLTVTFSDQSSGSINTWFWDFGDGGSSTEANPTHVYEEAGNWDVTLTVLGPSGTDVEFKFAYIEAGVLESVISGQNVSNIRDTSFTVSWLTDLSSDGYVEYGVTAALGQVAGDVRGGGYTGFTHYVQVVDLQPGTTYYFDIVSGSTRDDNGGAHYTVTTGPTLVQPGSDMVHGLVYQDDGATPADGAIVLITLTDRDGGGDLGSAALLSTLTDESGTWTADLGYARLPDLGGYFQYSPSGDTLFLEATGGPLGDTCLYEDTGSDSPSADIVLGDPCVIQVPIEGLVATNDSPTPLGNLTTLTATVTSGSNVGYAWDFGDGELGSGEVVSHTYPAVGVYTAVVTASNSVSSLTSTTPVTITELTFCNDVSEIPQTECVALVTLYNSTDGPHWSNNSGWLETTTPCSWYGVTCSAGRVSRLSLDSNQLSGNIPLELGGLANLEYLILNFNQLGGNIPLGLGGLANLLYLGLSGNQLSGYIPPGLGGLANLQGLVLGENQLSGTIPPDLGGLANLQTLDLGSNQLSGIIPPELGGLANLHTLHLGHNQLSGIIPLELGGLVNLQDLFLDSNQLSGNIPPELGGLMNLQRLYLDSNQLSGNIPLEMGQLADLEYLILNFNQLSGNIPPELGGLTNLQHLILSSNQLSGTIPLELGSLVNLEFLDLGYNMLTASDPAVLSFLNEKDPDWADTQTVPPADLQVTAVTASSVQLSWTPISYTGDGGYYEVSYATSPGGPYTVHGPTPDKTASSYAVGSLETGVTYHFVVRTYTPAHGPQQNDLWSWYSEEVSATTTVDLGTLNLTVDLQGRTDDSGVLFTVWSGGQETGSCISGQDGTCSLPLASGTYSVTAEMSSYLDSTWDSVSITEGGSVTLPTVTLLGGDTNDDCVINIQDLSFMGYRFNACVGDPLYDLRGDINGDGCVNILDLAMAGGNFDRACPVPW